MKNAILTIIISFCCMSAIAAQGNLVTIEGTVKSFDKDTVQITTEKSTISVPRKFIPAKIPLKANAKITLPISEEQLKEIK